jgi:glycosyltransferase involved in cell wall biosynthesis
VLRTSRTTNGPRWFHVAALDELGGLQTLLASLLAEESDNDSEIQHVAVNRARGAATSAVTELLQRTSAVVRDARLHDPAVQGAHLLTDHRVVKSRTIAARTWTRPEDTWLFWNIEPFWDPGARRAAKVAFYDHGHSWLHSPTDIKRDRINASDRIIANSEAAEAMLRLRWGVEDRITVVRNPVRRDVLPAVAPVKSLPRDRPVRLGAVGRLEPFKGFAVAILAVRHLLRQGVPVELHIAGNGPERSRLRDLTRRLAISDRVRFHGEVTQMTQFYRNIDVLVCPSLREPFGLVSVEAQAWGCPVVAARVDGLPETLSINTGILLQPNLSLNEYYQLGVTSSRMPPVVYDPEHACLTRPKAIQPEAIANAVTRLLADPGVYRGMSSAAGTLARTKYDFAQYVEGLKAALQ